MIFQWWAHRRFCGTLMKSSNMAKNEEKPCSTCLQQPISTWNCGYPKPGFCVSLPPLLPTSSGIGQCSIWSNRPGRSNAGSMRSGLEVAATTNMPCESPSTPSNWVNNWLTTRSVTPVLSWPRLKKQFYKKISS